MIVYSITLSVSLFIAKLSSLKNGKSLLFFAFFIIFIFSALRFNYGNDYLSYLDIYREINSSVLSSLNGETRYEFGWVLLNIICKYFPFQSIIFIVSFINCFAFYKLIVKYVDPAYYVFALFIYLADANIFLINLSAMRQSIAIIFVLRAIDLLSDKKYIYFLVYYLLAINFHTSSLTLLPVIIFFFLLNTRINYFYILFFLSIYITAFIFKDYLKQYVVLITTFFFDNRYPLVDSDSNMSFVNFFSYLILLFFLFYYHNRLDSKFQFFAKLLMFAIVIIPIDFILPLAGRMTYYFLTLSIIIFPRLASVIKNQFLKVTFILFTTLIISVRLFNFFTSETYSESYKNYKTIIFH